MVLTIFLASIFSIPTVVKGNEQDFNDALDIDKIGSGVFKNFREDFGEIFGRHLGHTGGILEAVFRLLFKQGLDLKSHEMLDNVFVLSANLSEPLTGTRNFGAEPEKDIYYLPEGYDVNTTKGFAYCEVEKQGSYDYNLEVGAAVTLVIWDNDQSFIDAITKLIRFFRKIMVYELDSITLTRELIREGVSLLTWFLIHINDIFTGDELFVLNPITWQELDINPTTYDITKNWMMSGPDLRIGTVDDEPVNSSIILDWINNATQRNDNYMLWLLNSTLLGDIAPAIWTQFSIDLIQLWIKNFEIHIDIAELIKLIEEEGADVAAAFGGCDIETYLFTHHFAGAYLYNDTMPRDGKLSVEYEPLRYPNGTIVTIDNTDVEVPKSSELTHRIILGSVDEFNFRKPTINPSNKSISWGLTIENATISPVPIGIDLDSYLTAPKENLEYVYFGFTFEPLKDPETGAAKGVVKLDQMFAPWNNLTNPYANSPITGLDFAIIYVSTSLYFHLNIATKGERPDDPTTILDEDQDYNNVSHEVKIGNYIGGNTKLDFIDIAGPYYEYGSELIKDKDNASTNTIDLALWKYEMDRHDTFVAESGDPVNTFATDIRIQANFSVMVYAICYPEFEEGTGIWHDPTFSVYMVFESEGFWALIVLIAGVGLVGVATILIKRRKDRRF